MLHYTAGKLDWAANDLPIDGELAGRTSGTLARRNVPICRSSDRVDEVRSRLQSSDWNLCVVTNDHNVVLGSVGKELLSAPGDQKVENVMQVPTTRRPHLSVQQSLRAMDRDRVDHFIVTTAAGVLVGVLERRALDQVSKAA